MPITASDTIAVGANTTTIIPLPFEVDKILATVVFYTSVAGTNATMVPVGTGTRTLTVSRVDGVDSTIGTLTMPIANASLATQAALSWGYIDLKTKTARISVVPSVGADATNSTHFRILIAS
jgi:hypothetical protein